MCFQSFLVGSQQRIITRKKSNIKNSNNMNSQTKNWAYRNVRFSFTHLIHSVCIFVCVCWSVCEPIHIYRIYCIVHVCDDAKMYIDRCRRCCSHRCCCYVISCTSRYGRAYVFLHINIEILERIIRRHTFPSSRYASDVKFWIYFGLNAHTHIFNSITSTVLDNVRRYGETTKNSNDDDNEAEDTNSHFK